MVGPSREGEMTVEHGLLKKFGIKSRSHKWRGELVHRYLRTPLYIALYGGPYIFVSGESYVCICMRIYTRSFGTHCILAYGNTGRHFLCFRDKATSSQLHVRVCSAKSSIIMALESSLFLSGQEHGHCVI
jgi:hypothetical protein